MGESLVIEYDNPSGDCGPSVTVPSKRTVSAIKREAEEKFPLSTDDLTCNVCGREYGQWTQLKQHLLDHIIIAQSAAECKAKVSESTVTDTLSQVLYCTSLRSSQTIVVTTKELLGFL